MKSFTYFFSGIETGTETTEKFFQAGMKIKGGMMSYMTMRGNKKYPAWLARFRKDYGGTVMVDSGAHAFLFAKDAESENKKEGWQPVNQQVEGLLKDPDAYVHEYMDWLEANRESYDWAVELDIQTVVGPEKVEAWRQEFVDRKIPVVIVVHPRGGEGVEVVQKWKAKGVTYFGAGGFDTKNMQDMRLLREMSAEGVKVHQFAFSPTDIGKYLEWLDSSDSSSWLSAGKLAQLITAKGRTYEMSGIKDNPILVKKAINTLSVVIDKKEMEEAIADKKYAYLCWYNMFEMQKWIDTVSHKPAYMTQLASAEKGETVLPAWVNDTDKFGRSKAIYLKSRFNNMKSGVYAREVQKYALVCDNCVVKDTCPVFEPGSLCFFTKEWKKLGAKTRNKEQIERVVENIVADKLGRLERGKYFEAQAGGMLDRTVSALEMDAVKSLELLHRMKYGTSGGVAMAVNVGRDGIQVGVAMSADKLLESVRDEYGDKLTARIQARMEKVRAVDVEEVKVVEEEQEAGGDGGG